MARTETVHRENMAKLTLGQAAKEANKAKSTILDAINSNRMSAPKGDKGQYEIDPAELFRVFPKTEQEPNTKTESAHLENAPNTAILQLEIGFLKRIIDDRDRERKGLEETINNLRGEKEDLLSVIKDQAGTVKQLTHQPEPKAAPAAILGASMRPWLIFAVIAAIFAAFWWWFSR